MPSNGYTMIFFIKLASYKMASRRPRRNPCDFKTFRVYCSAQEKRRAFVPFRFTSFVYSMEILCRVQLKSIQLSSGFFWNQTRLDCNGGVKQPSELATSIDRSSNCFAKVESHPNDRLEISNWHRFHTKFCYDTSKFHHSRGSRPNILIQFHVMTLNIARLWENLINRWNLISGLALIEMHWIHLIPVKRKL